jgi:hypothetical protein
MLPSPLGSRPRPSGPSVSRVKTWARQALNLADDVTVLVSELNCKDPGCPDTETVIAVLKTPCASAKYRILKPLDAITQADVSSACAVPSEP